MPELGPMWFMVVLFGYICWLAPWFLLVREAAHGKGAPEWRRVGVLVGGCVGWMAVMTGVFALQIPGEAEWRGAGIRWMWGNSLTVLAAPLGLLGARLFLDERWAARVKFWLPVATVALIVRQQWVWVQFFGSFKRIGVNLEQENVLFLVYSGVHYVQVGYLLSAFRGACSWWVRWEPRYLLLLAAFYFTGFLDPDQASFRIAAGVVGTDMSPVTRPYYVASSWFWIALLFDYAHGTLNQMFVPKAVYSFLMRASFTLYLSHIGFAYLSGAAIKAMGLHEEHPLLAFIFMISCTFAGPLLLFRFVLDRFAWSRSVFSG